MAELRIAELRRIGAGREAEVYALDEDRVLRLARTPALRAEVENERRALLAAERCGAPVPRCFERLDADGRPGLVLERLDAGDLLTGMLRRPWEVAALPSVLAKLHVSLHETVAPAELPDLHTEVAERLASELVPPDVRVGAERALAQLPRGDRLCHGDFHPGNVIRRRNGSFVVIDWKAAARGHPDADVARTRLLILGAWIPGVPRRLQLGLRPFRGRCTRPICRLTDASGARGSSISARGCRCWQRLASPMTSHKSARGCSALPGVGCASDRPPGVGAWARARRR